MNERSPITTHVLDISRGRPATHLPVKLEYFEPGKTWSELGRGSTGSEGRLETLLPPGSIPSPGTYRLTFSTETYFKSQGVSAFYPEVTVTFQITNPKEHHHVPLLLSPFGFSTYRGT